MPSRATERINFGKIKEVVVPPNPQWPNAEWARVRLGVLGNNEDDCGSPDSRIGFGGAGAPCGGNGAISCGNVCACGGDAGDRSTATFGYVLVR